MAESKPSLLRRVWDAVVHAYHGFRLLALDTRVAARLLWKTMKGNSLTRREQKQVGGPIKKGKSKLLLWEGAVINR